MYVFSEKSCFLPFQFGYPSTETNEASGNMKIVMSKTQKDGYTVLTPVEATDSHGRNTVLSVHIVSMYSVMYTPYATMYTVQRTMCIVYCIV